MKLVTTAVPKTKYALVVHKGAFVTFHASQQSLFGNARLRFDPAVYEHVESLFSVL